MKGTVWPKVVRHFRGTVGKTSLSETAVSWVTSQRIFSINNIAKNINSLLSPDPIPCIYVLQDERNPIVASATIYVNNVRRLHGSLLFSAPVCIWILIRITEYTIKRNAATHSKSRSAPNCRVLPPGELNNIDSSIMALLIYLAENFICI